MDVWLFAELARLEKVGLAGLDLEENIRGGYISSSRISGICDNP